MAELERTALSAGDESNKNIYEFDRKFLFRVLVLGNAQLAQIIKAKGPNMQTNAACAGDNNIMYYSVLYLVLFCPFYLF